MRTKRILTAEERRALSLLYYKQGYNVKQLGEYFKCGYTAIKQAFLVGELKLKPHQQNSGNFQKGNVAWNTGLKGFHPSPETSYKKGNIPANTHKVGTITERFHKGETKTRRWIKYDANKKMMPYSRWLWIEEYGEIIKGDKIIHLDRDTLNDSVDNLLALPPGMYLKASKFSYKLSRKQINFYIIRYLNRI